MIEKAKLNQFLLSIASLTILIASALLFSLLVKHPQFQYVVSFVQQHLWGYLVFLLLFKILSVVYPPVPGAIISLASIPLIGWDTRMQLTLWVES